MTTPDKLRAVTRLVQHGWLDFAETVPHWVEEPLSADEDRRTRRAASAALRRIGVLKSPQPAKPERTP